MSSADAGDRAERDFRLAELGGIGGDDDVAHHGEFATAAEGVAADGGNGRLAAGGQAAAADAGEVGIEHVDEALRLHFLDVGAGGKRLFIACNEDAADGGVILEIVDRGRDFAKHAE